MLKTARPPGERRASDGKKQTVHKHTNPLAIARQLLKRFCGRDDYVAVGSDTGTRPERLDSPLTAKRLAAEHLSGLCWLGFYLLSRTNQVSCTCVDFDNKPERPDPDWRRKTRQVVRFLQRHGLHPLIEISQSGRAAHIWLFFNAPVPAWLPRAFWRAVLKKLGIKEPEIFPRQDRLKDKKLGNCVRYPLFNKSCFVDLNDGWKAVSPLPALEAVKPTSAPKLKRIAARLGAELSPAPAPIAEACEGNAKTRMPPRVKQLLAEEPGSTLARRWGDDTSGLNDTSRSALVFAIACCLIRRYLPTAEIQAALRRWCEARSYDKGSRADWLPHQIAAAYDFVFEADRKEYRGAGSVLVFQTAHRTSCVVSSAGPSGERNNHQEGKDPEMYSNEDGAELEVEVGPRMGGGSNARSVVKFTCGEVTYRDEINVNRAEHRRRLVRDVANRLGADVDDIDYLDDVLVQKADEADDLVEKEAKSAEDAEDESREQTAAEISKSILKQTPPEVRKAAEQFLNNAKIIEQLESDFKKLGIVGELALAMAIYLVGTSRKLPQPAGAVVQSASSAGKSYVTNTVTSLMPDEDVISATDITDQAFYYLPQGSLKHKLVVLAERKHADYERDPTAANSTLALREMLSSGELKKLVTLKRGDGLETVTIRQEGPIAYLETTTMEQIFDEDATRLMSLVADESPSQTAAIIGHLGREAAGKTTSPEEQEAIRQKHKTAQRLLKPYRVKIPFAEHLKIPTDKLVARRAFTQLLIMISAVALLRQFKKKKYDGYIVATLKDYEIAYGLMAAILRRVLAPLSDGARKLLDVIRSKLRDQDSRREKSLASVTEFVRAEVVKWSGLSLTAVRQRLDTLCEAGLIEQIGGGKGTTCVYKLGKSKADQVLLSDLVSPEKLRKLLEKPAAV